MLDRPYQTNLPASSPVWVSDYRFRVVLTWMVWLQLFYMIVAFDELLGQTTGLLRPIKMGLLGASILLIVWRSGLTWLLLRTINPFLTGFVVFAGMSVAWSIEPSFTINRMISLISLFAVCVAFGLVSWERTKFQDLMIPIITAILIGSLLLGMVNRSLVTEVGDTISLSGAWKGLTLQKNSFGQVAAFGVILWYHSHLTKERSGRSVLVGFFISGLCLILSKSSTSLLSSVFGVVFLTLLLRSPPNLKRYMPLIVTIFALLVLVFSTAVLRIVPGLEVLLQPIVMVTGKDLTFSNRSVIWDIIREHVKFAPMLGTGYGAYWLGVNYPWSPSFEFYALMYFYPGQSHNGYLEVINDLGYIGGAILAGYLFVLVKQSLTLLKIDRPQGALYLALFFMQTMTNLSQSIWFQYASFEFVIMMFATVALGRALLDHKLRAVYSDTPNDGSGRFSAAGSPIVSPSPLHWRPRG